MPLSTKVTSACQGSLQLAPDFHRNALCHFRTPKSLETPAILLLVPTEARMDSELVLDIKPSPGDCLPYLLHTSLFSHYPRAYLAPPAHTVAPHFLMQYRGLDSSLGTLSKAFSRTNERTASSGLRFTSLATSLEQTSHLQCNFIA
ncbi:uncharacterized protein [Penaeus vannamei]|uniref:uncharacterized protein n=1 Tax=Penaeus vannamei TaxID=6689 RepID=UPI00387F9BB3